MSSEKNKTIITNILAVVVLGSGAYTFFLSKEVDNISKKNNTLEEALSKNVTKLEKQLSDNKYQIYFACDTDSKDKSKEDDTNKSLLNKLKNLGRDSNAENSPQVTSADGCPPVRFCEVSNIFNKISFTKKKYETSALTGSYQKGTYYFSSNSLFLMPTETSQRELQITDWDEENNIIEFYVDGKHFSQTSCKSPDQEKAEQDKILAQKYEKESAEKEKMRLEKVEKDRMVKEKIERDLKEDERAERENLLKSKLQEVVIKLQKLENEKIMQDQKEKERLEKEAINREILEKEKAKKVNIKVKSY